jgi:UDP-N-acetylmuramoyl-tripeptide--D-alanyl-D-alanine ligase
MHTQSHLRCSDIVRATGGRLLQGNPETPFAGLSTDTRTIRRGEAFLALRGERFDGHTFVPEAARKGAAGTIVQNGDLATAIMDSIASIPIIAVPETLRALGDTARYWRDRFSIPVIGITGSNGKTTAKEMIAFLLEERFRVLRSPGNFNNLVGLPLTLLGLEPTHEVAVVEMGTNRPGEIRRLTEIARPTVGIITNIGQAHLEGMGSMETLVEEKGALFRAVAPDGTLVVNTSDPHVASLAGASAAKTISYGVNTKADVMIDRVECRGSRGITCRIVIGEEESTMSLPVVGLQFASTVAAAAAVARLFEMDVKAIKERLVAFPPLPMRMEVVSVEGVTFINDAYNANPSSVQIALETLAQIEPKGRTFVVLGDMLELGDISQAAHKRVGQLLGTLDVAGVFLLGAHATDVVEGAVEKGMIRDRIWIARTHRDIVNLLKAHISPGDWVLVKGSRGMRMEAVIEAFREKN